MAIQFDKEKNIFTLESKNTAYQIMIGDYGVLQHLYYGKRVGKCDMSYLVQMYDRGFSGQIPDAGNRREFSMDTLLQEYSTYGTGDYRTESLRIIDGNGGYGADLRYESHKIYKGKYSICGLPAMYAKEEEADTLEIKLKDFTTNVAVILYYGVFHELDIITRAVTVINEGTETIILEKVASACLEFYHKEFDMVHFHGKHAMERELERLPIRHGMQSIGSVRGTSSHQHNPFVILCSKNATETTGDCYAMSFVYSGNFLAEVEVDQIEQTRMVMGIHPTQFSYQLKQGEVFDAPEVVMSYSGEGFSKLSNTFHKAYRNHLCRGKYKLSRRPILINNWEATYFQFDEEKLFQIAKEAKELGVVVMPMPFYINGQMFYEDIDLTQEQFYQKLKEGGEIKTSMPLVGDVTDKWDELLKEYDEIVYIPMSSGLSSSCETAYMLSQDYDGKVQVVNNQRISVTMRQSVLDAKMLAEQGKGAEEIKEILEKEKFESSIYIMVDTLEYLKKGGRITPAAAALGTLLKLKPVLQIQGEKLDAFAKARTVKQAKTIMTEAMKNDFEKRFHSSDGEKMNLELAYTFDTAAAEAFKEEVQAVFPDNEIVMQPLSLSIACHIGPGALAIACSKKIEA